MFGSAVRSMPLLYLTESVHPKNQLAYLTLFLKLGVQQK